MPARLLPLLLLVALAWGCASAEGAYKDGMDLEVSGDHAAAADAYVRALERDRRLPNVAGRLAVAGREAVRRWTDGAGALDPVGAADAYLSADALVRRAAAVGVDLERRPTFAADRDAAFDGAVLDLLRQSDAAAEAYDYAGALRRLDRARAYRPSPEQQAALDGRARDAHAGWAQADADAGRYRAAYGRLQSALALTRSDDPALDDLLAVQDQILAEGTLVAAVFPAEAAGADLPRGFLRDLDDVLSDDRLAALPPLLALVDPAEVRREVRQRGTRRDEPNRTDSPRRTADHARALGADAGVAVEVGPFVRAETAGEWREERARVGTGTREVTYRRRTVRLTLTATAAFTAVNAATGRLACEDEVRESATASYDVALYDGDWRTLDLPRATRALFRDDVAQIAEDDLLLDLRDEVAGALADRVVRCLEAQVP